MDNSLRRDRAAILLIAMVIVIGILFLLVVSMTYRIEVLEEKLDGLQVERIWTKDVLCGLSNKVEGRVAKTAVFILCGNG